MAAKKDIRWIAGLYEGEGTCYIETQQGKYRYARMKVSMLDEDVVREWARLVGASVYGPWDGTMYTASIHSTKRVAALARRMMPYLGTRRIAQIERVLTATERAA